MTYTSNFQAPSSPQNQPSGHYDAVVVGARVAGAATAMLLARAGKRVLVIDKAAYGSNTLSSHALMRGGVSQLARWGLLDRVFEAGTPVITSTTFVYGDDTSAIDIAATSDIPGLAAPHRSVLDRIMVDAAFEAGAEVRHETQLLAIRQDTTGRVRGVEIRLPDRSTTAVSTDLLIGADGLRSTVARELDVPITHQGSAASSYILQYFGDVALPTDRYTWLYKQGCGAGVIPTNDGQFCVFAAMAPKRFVGEARYDLGAAMDRTLTHLNPQLAATLRDATMVGPVRGWPGVPGQFRQAYGPGWALVGDAGYFKDPFAAHGISDAFRDAELVTDAALTGDFGRYEALRNDLSRPLFDVLERIAGYDWDLTTLPSLHMALSKAMGSEHKALDAARAEATMPRDLLALAS